MNGNIDAAARALAPHQSANSMIFCVWKTLSPYGVGMSHAVWASAGVVANAKKRGGGGKTNGHNGPLLWMETVLDDCVI